MVKFDLIKKAIEEDKSVSKKIIQQQAKEIVDVVEDGDETAMRIRFELKVLQSVIEEAMSKLSKQAYEEAQDYEDKEFKYLGATIKKTLVGVKYDYSVCPKWNNIKANEDVYATERKELEEKLKNGEVVDEETGEVYVPKRTSGTQTLSYTF